jgi:hypothetical protein
VSKILSLVPGIAFGTSVPKQCDGERQKDWHHAGFSFAQSASDRSSGVIA